MYWTIIIGGDGSLTYTFPEGTGEEPTVEYKTWIPKESYYYEHRNPPGNLGRSYRDMRGTVELRQDNDTLAEAGQEISFAPDWIQASASYDHPNETITWTIVVNKYDKPGLKNFTITNMLPAGLEFISAAWQTWNNDVASAVTPITPDANGVYSAVDETGEVTPETIATIKANVNAAQLWKQYHPGTLQSSSELTMKSIPLTVNGEVVADLIKVTGYNTDQSASFSFRSLETNPNVLFRQNITTERARWNRALLFEGEE